MNKKTLLSHYALYGDRHSGKKELFCMGYFKIPDWFVDKEMRGMTDCELRILVFLMRVSNKKGKSWYAQDTIAEITNLRHESVSRTMTAMKKYGWITTKKRFHDTTIVTVHASFLDKSM